MNDIKQLITQKENRKLEFKQTLPNTDKIIKTAIAFSNSQGGDLIIGVTDNNKLVGINDDDIINFEENISNIIYDNCSPTIIPEIYTVIVDKKMLLVVHFYPSNQKPHFIKKYGKHKATFVRVGSSNRLATIEIIEELERQKRRISFDSVINYELEYKDNILVLLDKHIEQKLDTKPSLSIGEVYRQDRWEYPLLALREVIINAVVHRNYQSRSVYDR